jgi:hypothetical protein
MGPYDITASNYLGVNISPSTESLSFLFERMEIVSLSKVAENAILIIYIGSRSVIPCHMSFRYSKYCGRRYTSVVLRVKWSVSLMQLVLYLGSSGP